MNDHFPNIDAVNDALRVLVHHHPVLRGAAQPATLASYRAGTVALAQALSDNPELFRTELAQRCRTLAEACDDVYCAALHAGTGSGNRYDYHPAGSIEHAAGVVYNLACVAMHETVRACSEPQA